MHKTTKITSIILAGGESSRMGTNKALLKIKGKRIIEYIFESLLPISDEILISCNSNDYDFLSAEKVSDIYKNIGPIGGIYSSLLKSRNKINLITSCDTPLLNTDFYKYLILSHLDYDISNPIHDEITEPIIGVFNKGITPSIKLSIKNRVFSPPSIFSTMNRQFINIDNHLPFYSKEMFLSANTKDDYNYIKIVMP